MRIFANIFWLKICYHSLFFYGDQDQTDARRRAPHGAESGVREVFGLYSLYLRPHTLPF